MIANVFRRCRAVALPRRGKCARQTVGTTPVSLAVMGAGVYQDDRPEAIKPGSWAVLNSVRFHETCAEYEISRILEFV